MSYQHQLKSTFLTILRHRAPQATSAVRLQPWVSRVGRTQKQPEHLHPCLQSGHTVENQPGHLMCQHCSAYCSPADRAVPLLFPLFSLLVVFLSPIVASQFHMTRLLSCALAATSSSPYLLTGQYLCPGCFFLHSSLLLLSSSYSFILFIPFDLCCVFFPLAPAAKGTTYSLNGDYCLPVSAPKDQLSSK